MWEHVGVRERKQMHQRPLSTPLNLFPNSTWPSSRALGPRAGLACRSVSYWEYFSVREQLPAPPSEQERPASRESGLKAFSLPEHRCYPEPAIFSFYIP